MLCACAVLCCHLWPIRLCHIYIFSHYLLNVRFSENRVWSITRVFWLSVRLLSETFLILGELSEISQMHITLVFIWITHYSCQILTEVSFSRQTFKKCSNFMDIRPVGAQFSHAGRQADRHDEGGSPFSQFCECA